MSADKGFSTPRDADLDLRRIANQAGLSLSILANGCVFALEHQHEQAEPIMLNQVTGSFLCGGIGRLLVRKKAPAAVISCVGPNARVEVGLAADRIVWAGETEGLEHRTTFWLHPDQPLWLWQVEITNQQDEAIECDAALVQDVGLGPRRFIMNNEAFSSQYVDHHIACSSTLGKVVMSRRTLAQDGRHPFLIHGCLEGAAGIATDGLQIFGPGFRDALDDARLSRLAKGAGGERLQHECACVLVRSSTVALAGSQRTGWAFFGLYDPDHPTASSDQDLLRLDGLLKAAAGFSPAKVALNVPARSFLQDAAPLEVEPLAKDRLVALYPERLHEEWNKEQHLLSFFVADGPQNRHVVLAEKERVQHRRHGTILRSGRAMLPDEATLGVTAWMHGVFAAQLTLGNTSFHKLFSVVRDPYNISRASGLRILADLGAGWRQLTVPSAFDIGLGDCRWIYELPDRWITVHLVASGDDPALHCQIDVEGPPCRFLIFGHLVLGDRELEHAGRVILEAERGLVVFRPDPGSLWGQHYPNAAYCLAVATSDALDALGGDELLYQDGRRRECGYIAMRTTPTRTWRFTVAGSLDDENAARRLALTHRTMQADLLAPGARYWSHVTREVKIAGGNQELQTLNTLLPWLAHNAMIHLTLPHGLEQYTGAAWGTRDVCQGPVEFLLALEHDQSVKAILRTVFAEQFETTGDWPQWFMHEPYAPIRDRHSHGDVIIWPLKALCDYLEATNDLAFLDEQLPWRDEGCRRTATSASVAGHVEKLFSTVRSRFVAGTHLISYGEGDWNDSLQPADPTMRQWMTSSWTVALLFQQTNRYAEVLRRTGRLQAAEDLAQLAVAMRDDFNRCLVGDGTVAGYALFDQNGGDPELLLHPKDRRTGLCYSLLPMTRSMIGGLFTPEQTAHHLSLIKEHLLFPDGVRLMDRPVRYRGGVETLFRRAESAAFFGREIGLMYVHAHLRYAEALAVVGDVEGLLQALQLVNPILSGQMIASASLRQRNAYFSSSDAAFSDRYQANAEWARAKSGDIAFDGGWRIYSSGPGLFVNILIRHVFGIQRWYGTRLFKPLLPSSLGEVALEMTLHGQRERWLRGADARRAD